MCGYCGCTTESSSTQRDDNARNEAHHSRSHTKAHSTRTDSEYDRSEIAVHEHHGHGGEQVLELSRHVLGENTRLAERVRGILLAKGVCALNLVSSPGSGKTALLERSARALVESGLRVGILVGDLATDNDAKRLQQDGVQVVQITTGTVCHLDAHMILHAFEHIDLNAVDVLFFENVGNLVCPASFDLGEDWRVVLTSVTEGEDKPHKYPTIFEGAHLALITKTDIADVLEVDMPKLRGAITDVAPGAEILELSSRDGSGMSDWFERVRKAVEAKRAVAI